jgi:hypothetical protein
MRVLYESNSDRSMNTPAVVTQTVSRRRNYKPLPHSRKLVEPDEGRPSLGSIHMTSLRSPFPHNMAKNKVERRRQPKKNPKAAKLQDTPQGVSLRNQSLGPVLKG